MQEHQLDGILSFLRSAEGLKTVTRSGWTSAGDRESVAEHTWRLCLMAMLLYGRDAGIDLARLLKICLIHDLGEAIGGDVPAPAQQDGVSKAGRERADLLTLVAPLPPELRAEIVGLWDEYEDAGSPEARLAKGLDKLETILQHTQGRNPDDFDYAFNLEYGRRYTGADPVLTALRGRLDAATARRGRLAAQQRALERVYRAFNARDAETLLAALHPDVRWANGVDGGWLQGREAVREYWTRQWATLDPQVEPMAVEIDEPGCAVVTAREVVRDRSGGVLLDTILRHAYRFEDGLVIARDVLPPVPAAPTAA